MDISTQVIPLNKESNQMEKFIDVENTANIGHIIIKVETKYGTDK